MEEFFRCPKCGGTLELSEKHVEHGKKPFNDMELNEDSSKFRNIYKCIHCGDYTKKGPWIATVGKS